jgi:hypothetical protein
MEVAGGGVATAAPPAGMRVVFLGVWGWRARSDDGDASDDADAGDEGAAWCCFVACCWFCWDDGEGDEGGARDRDVGA